jgi:hypothetical protein
LSEHHSRYRDLLRSSERRNFDGAADGRLLVVTASPERRSGTFPTSIAEVLNWFEELEARVPSKEVRWVG